MSDTREALAPPLRGRRGVDRDRRAARAAARGGKVKPKVVADAIQALDFDPEKLDPLDV